MSHSWSWWVAVVGLMVSLVDGLDNGVARTPPMGWRNWNFFGGAITQDIMEHQFRAMAVIAQCVLIASDMQSQISIRATSPYHTATQSNQDRSCACARVHALVLLLRACARGLPAFAQRNRSCSNPRLYHAHSAFSNVKTCSVYSTVHACMAVCRLFRRHVSSMHELASHRPTMTPLYSMATWLHSAHLPLAADMLPKA